MNIIILLGRYPPVFGGATPNIMHLYQKFSEEGHNVSVITPQYDSSHSRFEKYKEINVFRIPSRLNTKIGQIKFAINFVLTVFKYSLKPDIIVDTVPFCYTLPILKFYSSLFNVVLVSRLSQIGSHEPTSFLKLNFPILKNYFLKSYDFIICISSALEKSCITAGISKDKFGIIHNCVDSEKRFFPILKKHEKDIIKLKLLKEVKGSIVILPGSVSSRKRTILAIEAWAILMSNYNLDATLIITGPIKSSGQQFRNDYVDKVFSLIKKHRLEKTIKLIGNVNNIEDYYRISDLLLFVSEREGLPNVLLEGMASGIPIVSTVIPDITSDIIENNKEGFLVDDDPETIANQVFKLLTNPKLCHKMSQLGLLKAKKKFNVDQVFKETEILFKSKIKKNKKTLCI